ncbi:helix-turn-helix transcriptional regulator [Chitinophaga sedimenti]|uniref:winged helix-turn-helix transcriptional regulator n=1 Tax=Chitinophaga sedimenti TaxID=2033606 RepID=UPI0020037498|nr:helix-turn-helix domain-containing protein [Chitinophaga sedimenti]MCK7556026.1 helix-turn-helix transcriptional regulator [Chitinophaga sedimenti]
MQSELARKIRVDSQECVNSLSAIDDALYVIGGKWKLRIIASLSDAPLRFNELQRRVRGISARVLSNELKELELNGFVKRRTLQTKPAVVEYELTPYSDTLSDVFLALNAWGTMHRKRIRQYQFTPS